MSDNASNYLETKILSLLLNGTSIAGLADNSNSPIAAFSLQLHTASPGDTGDCATNEATYTGYARISVERTSSGWTVTGSSSATASASPTTTLVFPQCTGGSNTITHFSIGNSTVAASTGIMYIYGALSPNITVSNGIIPRITTASVITIT